MEKKKSPLIFIVIVVSVIVHVVAAVVASLVYIVSEAPVEKPEFEAVEKVREEPPEQKQVKVRLKNQAKRSSAPKKWIQADLSRVETQDITVDMGDEPSGIGGIGGGGLGGGLGALKFSASEVSFKGIKAKGEKVFFVIDASSGIMKDSRGGFFNYKNIRDDINKNIKSLNARTLFNAIAYSDHNNNRIFNKKNLVLASEKNKKAFTKWVNDLNADAAGVKAFRHGKKVDRFYAYGKDETAYRESPLKELAAAFSMHSDLIFWVTAKFPVEFRIRRDLNAKELKELEKYAKKHKAKSAEDFKKKVHGPTHKEYHKKRDELVAAENARRKKKGLPPMVAGSDIAKFVRSKGLKKPAMLDAYHNLTHKYHTTTAYEAIKPLIEREYEDRGMDTPSVNVVLFKGKEEEIDEDVKKAVRRFVSKVKGKHRILEGLEPVKK